MIYLDNAATTLYKPEPVRKAVYEAMGTMGNSGREPGALLFRLPGWSIPLGRRRRSFSGPGKESR